MQVRWFEELCRRAMISDSEKAELYRRYAKEIKRNAIAKAKDFIGGFGEATAAFTTQLWTCYDRPGGRVLWTRTATNLWTTQGCTWVWNNALASVPTYLALIAGAVGPTFAIGDTMASHAGWSEILGSQIVQVSRPVITFGAVTAGVISNSGAALVYQMAASLAGSLTLQGGAMTDNATLGGATGNLISEATFDQGAAVVAANNQVSIIVTATLIAG